MNTIFSPADILIPEKTYLEKWSVIACDQFSSQRDYWERVRSYVGSAPSALNMIIPEAYLAQIDEDAQIKTISAAMGNYLENGIFNEVRESFIYVKRTLPDGRIRRGLVGIIDLEHYDFKENNPAIRASEGTILERLPARANIRRAAPLETPHIIAFINDAGKTVIEPLAGEEITLPVVYDFDLMEGGGHIKGMQVSGSTAQTVKNAVHALEENNNVLMVIGDGNHSLAGAKVYWNELRQGLSEEKRRNHPARKALVEVCNVYDPAIDFEAIHRVLFNIDTPGFLREFQDAVQQGGDYVLRWVSKEGGGEIGIKAGCIGDMLEAVQGFIDGYLEKSAGSSIDYVHGEAAAADLAKQDSALGLILPAMDKSELFKTVAVKGVFPRKSFSVGHAKDKRYYLECRKIK